MMKRIVGSLSILLLLILALSACGSKKENFSSSESGYMDGQVLLGANNRFAGVVVAGEETQIEKDESKTIKKIKVSVGDTVEKGQVLFTYDGSQAQFDYEKAVMELEQMRMSLDTYARQREELVQEKASAPQSEQLSYTIQIQEIDTSVRETTYKIGLKEKEVKKLERGLKNLKVISPVSGTVSKIQTGDNQDGGEDYENFEDYGGYGGGSEPFMVITKANEFRVKAFINEENIASLSEGTPVLIRSRVDDMVWYGEVSEIDFDTPQQTQSDYMDEESEITRSSKYPFYVVLQGSDGLMLGQHVYVEAQ